LAAGSALLPRTAPNRGGDAMQFRHSSEVRADFPQLVAGVIHIRGVTRHADVEAAVARFSAAGHARLAASAEGELPEIQAWRRAFSRMGLKPTQYRCASEALLRRLRKEGALPRIHPLIDLCNAASLAWAIPVAALDLARIDGDLEVRRATGTEDYETFAGEVEHPEPGEVIFADAANRAHARRWTNRQSGRSAVRDDTAEVLIVAEALHDTASADVARLVAAIESEVRAAWPVAPEAAPELTPVSAILTAEAPGFAL